MKNGYEIKMQLFKQKTTYKDNVDSHTCESVCNRTIILGECTNSTEMPGSQLGIWEPVRRNRDISINTQINPKILFKSDCRLAEKIL